MCSCLCMIKIVMLYFGSSVSNTQKVWVSAYNYFPILYKNLPSDWWSHPKSTLREVRSESVQRCREGVCTLGPQKKSSTEQRGAYCHEEISSEGLGTAQMTATWSRRGTMVLPVWKVWLGELRKANCSVSDWVGACLPSGVTPPQGGRFGRNKLV